MANLYTESWPGASGAALPAAWASTLATGGSATQSGAGYATLNPGAAGSYLVTYSYLSSMAATVDTEVTGSLSHSVITESYSYVSVRATAATGATGATYYTSTGYTLLLYATSGGGLQLTVAKAGTEFTGTGQTITKAGLVTANGQVNYRFRVTGTTTTRIQARAWTGATEPTAWDLDFNDASSPQTAAGRVRITAVNQPIRFYGLSVTDGVAGTALVATAALSGSGSLSTAASGGQPMTPLTAWTNAFIADNANLLMIGTSLTEGQAASARTTRWAELIQAPLRTAAGVPTSGSVGYLPAWYNTWSPSTWTPYSAQAGTHANSNVTDLSLGRRVDNMSASATKTYTVTGTAADIHWIRGYGSFTYKVDSAAAVTVSTAGTAGAPMTTRISLGTSGSHTIVLTATSAVRISGIMVYNNDTTTGVRFFEAGHSTYEASNYTGMTAMWNVVQPDLALVELGANEFLNNTATPAVTKSRIQTIISELRAAVTGKPLSVAVVVAGSWLQGAQVAGQTQTWAAYQAAIRSIATDDPTVGVIEMPSLTSGQLNADAIHPNDTGQQVIANAMVAALNPAPALTAPASLSGSGTVVADGRAALRSTVTLSGSGTVVATQTAVSQSRSVALSGSGTVTTTFTSAFTRSVALSGSGSLTTSSKPAFALAAQLAGEGTTLWSAQLAGFARTIALDGSGSLATTALKFGPVNPMLYGFGDLQAAAGSPSVGAAVSIIGQGTLSAALSAALRASATLSGTGTLTSAVRAALSRAASLSGSGTLVAIYQSGVARTADLSGLGTLSFDAGSNSQEFVQLAGSGALLTNRTAALRSTPALTGAGTVLAVLLPRLRVSAALAGSGSLAAVFRAALAYQVGLTGDGQLVALHGGIGPARRPNLTYVWDGRAWVDVKMFAWRDGYTQTYSQVKRAGRILGA